MASALAAEFPHLGGRVDENKRDSTAIAKQGMPAMRHAGAVFATLLIAPFPGAAAAVAVAGISPAARSAAIRAALARLADEDLTTAVHGLAALLRAERDAAIQASRSRA